MFKNNQKLIVLMFACVFFLVSIGLVATSQEKGETLVIAAAEEIETMLPYRTTGQGLGVPARFFYEALFRIDRETQKPEPSAVEDWEVSEDGLTYTFHLYEGIKWHKGYGELTAKDVLFTYDFHLNPEKQSVHKDMYWMVEDLEAIDDYTVRFHLSEPFGSIYFDFCGFMSRSSFEPGCL